MNLRIAFQAEIDRGGRTRVLDVVAYGARSDKGDVRIALLEWLPGIELSEAEQAHLKNSATRRAA